MQSICLLNGLAIAGRHGVLNRLLTLFLRNRVHKRDRMLAQAELIARQSFEVVQRAVQETDGSPILLSQLAQMHPFAQHYMDNLARDVVRIKTEYQYFLELCRQSPYLL